MTGELTTRMELGAGVVAVPCTEVMWTRSAAAISAAIRRLPDSVEAWYEWSQVPTIEKRSIIARTFLAEPKHQWLMFLDSDMVPEPTSLVRLAAAAQEQALDILAAHCFTRHGVPFRACGGWVSTDGDLTWIEPPHWDGEIHEVDWVGTGCLYLSRHTLERLGQRRGNSIFRPPMHLSHVRRGEDQEFCSFAKSVGFSIHYHTGIPIGHLGLIDVNEQFVSQIDRHAPPTKVRCPTIA